MKIKELINKLLKHDGELDVLINAESTMLEDVTSIEVAKDGNGRKFMVLNGDFEED